MVMVSPVRLLAIAVAVVLTIGVFSESGEAWETPARLAPVFGVFLVAVDPYAWAALVVPAACVITKIPANPTAALAKRPDAVLDAPGSVPASPIASPAVMASTVVGDEDVIVAGPLPAPLANAQGIPDRPDDIRPAPASVDGDLGTTDASMFSPSKQ